MRAHPEAPATPPIGRERRRSGLLVFMACFALAARAASPAGTSADEASRILEALALGGGMSAADVGAGDGDFTVVLAQHVGATGRVFATEVDPAELEKVKARASSQGLANVTTVLADQQQTGLPEGCCDAVLLRLVYHHFTDPPAMRRGLWRALRPGGRIAVIDVPPQSGWSRLAGVPERGGHGIRADELAAEMRAEGFELLARHEAWPAEADSYCIVFRRPAGPSAGPQSSSPSTNHASRSRSRKIR
jgi:predicted methyltransferase